MFCLQVTSTLEQLTNPTLPPESAFIESHFNLDSCFSDPFCAERKSKDKVVNTCGRQLLNMCMTYGLHIANGKCGEDADVGEFTYLAPMGKSVVD
jgi:hypothetical protein